MNLLYQNRKTSVFSILLLLLVCFSTRTMSQTTITTNFTVNNGFAIVTFNFTNGTGGAIIVTDIGSVCSAAGQTDVAAYYKTSAIAGAPGAINAGNGWSQFGTGSIAAVGATIQPFMSGLSLIIPAGATYGMCVEAKTTGGGTGNLAYSTLAGPGPFTFTGGSCTLTTGANIGFAGDVVPNAPTFTPRGFIGSITFINAAPCSGTPAPGNTLSSVPTVCPGTNFTLSLQNPPGGSGVTYQWQSAPTLAGPFTPITGATNSTYTTTLTAATAYQCTATCTGNSGTSIPVQVALTPPSSCYCTPPTTNCNLDDDILNVLFAGINNSSLCGTNGYTNYVPTVAPASVVAGGSYPMSVTVGPGGTEYVGVWIDANQNGNFETTEFTALGTGNGVTITNNVVVPAGATLGTTRMRIRVRYNTPLTGANACLGYAFGETEDYAITINPCIPATITTQPVNASILCGSDASFSATVTGSLPVYKWQVKTSAAAFWTDLANNPPYSGVTTATLSIASAPVSMNGYRYRLLYSGACKAIDSSNVVTLTVNTYVANVSPTSAIICNGSSQQLTITNTLGNLVTLSEGFNTVPVAGWATKQNSSPLGPTGWFQGTPAAFPSFSGAANSYIAADYQNTDPAGTGTISNWLITPVLNIKNGDLVTFYSRIPAGAEFPDRLEIRVSANGNSIDVGNTATSVGDFTTVILTINPTLVTGVYPKVWTQFTATVSGVAAPTTGRIAFRYYDTDAGGNAPNGNYIGIDDMKYISTGAVATGIWSGLAGTMFTNAGLTTAYTGTPENTIYVNPTVTTTYTVVVTTATCVSGVTSIPVTVNNPVGTVTAPSNASICAGGNTSFTVSAASGNTITYKWEVSTDGGGTWTTVTNGGVYSGATTATLTLTNVPSTYTNRKYRSVLTVSACSSTVTSGVATLTVNPLPVVVIEAGPYTQIRPGLTTTLTAAVSPNAAATYQWYKNGVAVPGADEQRLVVGVDDLGEYTVSVNDVNGCGGTAVSSIVISAAASDIMFIYPSPNTGQFQVRYQSLDGNLFPRTLTIYDSKGSQVYSKIYDINAPYSKMEVDLSNHGKGIYRVELGDRNGKRIKTGSVLIL